MKKVITLLITIALCFILIIVYKVNVKSIDISFTYEGTVYYYSQLDDLKQKQSKAINNKQYANDMANSARKLGYKDDCSIIQTAKQEWNKAEKENKKYEKIIAGLKNEYNTFFQSKKKEYPVATEIWIYLKDKGYNDYVIAGIMGNLMAETGGNTLSIVYDICGNGYYGICQWNKAYKSKVWYTDLKEQCKFLCDTIEYEMNTYGSNYQKNFNYKSFCELTNEQKAAKAFAKCYERCGSATYSQRERNATKALKYFTTK